MAGQITPYDMTYLTAPVTYRSNIADEDISPLEDAASDAIPEIRVDIDRSKQAIDQAVKHAPKYEVSSRAYNAHLELYIHLDASGAGPKAGIKVWGWSGGHNIAGRWCLVHEQEVLTDTLICLRSIPNTKYKVTVSALADATVAAIIEQHTV